MLNSTAERRVNTTAAPPMTEPMSSGFFSPRYRAMRTVTPMANWVTTKVTRLSTWLPVETADRPMVEPNRPTTSRSRANSENIFYGDNVKIPCLRGFLPQVVGRKSG